jgi:hypothetical protein
MVFYYNDDEIIQVQIHEPSENSRFIMTSEIEYLMDMDIKNFNYYVFESDIEKLSNEEFEYWYQEYFYDWINNLNESFLDVDINELEKNFKTPEEKRLFLKKVVFFVMHIFPYEIIKGLVQDIKSYPDLIPDSTIDPEDIYETDFYNIFDIDNPNIVNLKTSISKLLRARITKLNNWIGILDDFSSVSKKDTLEDSVKLLETHINKQNMYNNMYIDIIEDTPIEHITNIINIYLQKDYLNLSN